MAVHAKYSQYIEDSVNIFQILTVFDIFWQYLTCSVSIWWILAIFTLFCQFIP